MTASKVSRSSCARPPGPAPTMPIEVAVAFKPVATVFQPQDTVNDQGEATTVRPRGRHDPCVLPRAVPMVEAMALLVLADHYLRQRAQCGEIVHIQGDRTTRTSSRGTEARPTRQ